MSGNLFCGFGSYNFFFLIVHINLLLCSYKFTAFPLQKEVYYGLSGWLMLVKARLQKQTTDIHEDDEATVNDGGGNDSG